MAPIQQYPSSFHPSKQLCPPALTAEDTESYSLRKTWSPIKLTRCSVCSSEWGLDCFVRACLNSTSSTSKAPFCVHQEPCIQAACPVHLPVHSQPPLVDSVSCLFACHGPDRLNLTLPFLAILQDFLFISTTTLLKGSRIGTSRDSLLARHAVGASSPGHKYHQVLGKIPNENRDPWWWASRQMLRSGQKHTVARTH